LWAVYIFAPTDIKGALTPKGNELPRLPARHAAALCFFLKVANKDDLAACVSVLGEESAPVRLDHGWLTVAMPSGGPPTDRAEFVREKVIGWYRGHAERRLLEVAETWAQRLNTKPTKVIVVEAQKRWGSATATMVVRVNWRVIQAPVCIVEYVIAHELVHLEHPNHTRQFWDTLGRVMPDCDHRNGRLRVLGPQLEW
jgi:predicted metal-dependent hydrolase